MRIRGIGEAQAGRLVAMLELSHLQAPPADERPRVTNPADGANLLTGRMAHLQQEELWVILLDTRNRVLDIAAIYRGSLNTSVVRIGEVFRPAAVTISPEAGASITAALAALETTSTDFGTALRRRDVLAAVQAIVKVTAASDWQAEQWLQSGMIGRALRALGYRTEPTWCQPYQFTRPTADERAQRLFLKEVREQRDPNKKLSLADGLAVYTPALTIDDTDDTLVYLEMVGAKQSVRANWAALVGGGKVHWVGRKRVRLEGMKDHVKIQATLPCGWANHILIHKQASLKEMNPEQPFYLLDDGTGPIPPLFYPMLNKCLALPLLESWAAYLWANGRERELISLLDEGQGQGYAAWRVLPAPEAWQEVVQIGLNAQEITF